MRCWSEYVGESLGSQFFVDLARYCLRSTQEELVAQRNETETITWNGRRAERPFQWRNEALATRVHDGLPPVPSGRVVGAGVPATIAGRDRRTAGPPRTEARLSVADATPRREGGWSP